MKLSNREKIMLYILGIIIVVLGYYKFVYTYQIGIINEKTEAKNKIEEKYNTAVDTINKLDSKKSDLKILTAKINNEAMPFYPTISQEHIILELDKLLKDSGLDGSIKFEPIASASVEEVDKKSEVLKDSSIEKIVDGYKNIDEDSAKDTESDTESEKESNSKNNNNEISNKENSNYNNSKTDNNENTNTTSSEDSQNDNKNSKDQNTIQYMKCEVDFQGSYDSLDKLLNTIGKNEKKIIVNSIKINEDTLNSVKGTINLEIYSIPKINDKLEDYLKWGLNNTYGKIVPFDTNAATGNVKDESDTQDFQGSVKSFTSDLPTVTLGKANDSLRTSYIYGDSNSRENAEMILAKDNDKYYYKYKTSKGSFPSNYNDIGREFVPNGDNILLKISSENRITSDDKSELNLKIINDTDKLLIVEIDGDDTANPRVTIDGDGNNIRVNKK